MSRWIRFRIYLTIDTPSETKEILKTSVEVWDFIKKHAGLDIKHYDAPIIDQIFLRLGEVPLKNLRKELTIRKVSVERFIEAFFKALEPYARMMTDLCVFFECHGAKRTDEQIRIMFDFGKGPQDLDFDLRHFMECLMKWKQIIEIVRIRGWDQARLWSLAEILEHTKRKVEDKAVLGWIERYDNIKGEFTIPLPDPPEVGVGEIDLWLDRIWRVWQSVVTACFELGPTRLKLEEAVRIQGKAKKTSERLSLEIPTFEEWDAQTLRIIDSDFWPRALAIGLYGWAEELQSQSRETRLDHARPTIESLEGLFASLPEHTEKRRTIKQVLEELLSLPIWKRRHELYQTWVITQLDIALAEYSRTIHHVNGMLLFRFSGTHLATIETTKGRVHLWSELRSPLENPLGEGRTGNIQPDYTLTLEPVTSIEKTIIVVETKQYLRAKAKNFANALIDYARGRPQGCIIIVNYGEIPNSIMRRVPSELRKRTYLIDNMRPGQKSAQEVFYELILQQMPPKVQTGQHTFLRTKLIAVDVSGSMKDNLERNDVRTVLQVLVEMLSESRLIAVDVTKKGEYQNTHAGLDELLRVKCDGQTNLPQALQGEDLSQAIVVTDEQGQSQLIPLSNRPFLLLVIDSKIAVYKP